MVSAEVFPISRRRVSSMRMPVWRLIRIPTSYKGRQKRNPVPGSITGSAT
jgi:hypothetical protein